MKTLAIVVISALTVLCILDPPSASQNSTTKQWTVEGDVTMDNGLAAGASISASGPFRNSVVADAKGHYTLKGSVPGYYLLSARSASAGPSVPKAVHVTPGAHLTSLDFHLARQAVISGRVVDADRNPLQGVSVSACVESQREGRLRLDSRCESSDTNDLGEYRIGGLSEGPYILLASLPPATPHNRLSSPNQVKAKAKRLMSVASQWYYPGVRTIDSAAPVWIQQSEQRAGINLVIAKAQSFCVRGAIVSPSGEQSAVVRLDAPVGDFSPAIARGAVNTQEEFEICGVTSGIYRLSGLTWDPETKKVKSYGRVDVTVMDGDTDGAMVYTRPAIPVIGKVKVAEASPGDLLPQGITVELLRRARTLLYGEDLVAHFQSNGDFEIPNVFPDDYGLSTAGLPSGYYVREAMQQSLDVLHGDVQPSRGELVILLGSDGGVIRGTSIDKEGNTVPDSTIILVAKDQHQYAPILTRQSDQEGFFEFVSNVPPGEYEIVALTGVYEGETGDHAFVSTQLAKATRISVEAKSSHDLRLRVSNAH